MVVPRDWPEGRFDLIVFSEVLYYLGLPGLHEAAARTLDGLAPGGCVLLVNWLGPTDGACSGDDAAELFLARAEVPPSRPSAMMRAYAAAIEEATGR